MRNKYDAREAGEEGDGGGDGRCSTMHHRQQRKKRHGAGNGQGGVCGE